MKYAKDRLKEIRKRKLSNAMIKVKKMNKEKKESNRSTPSGVLSPQSSNTT